ncbi:MAG: uncharacterized UPF0160 family protein [Candidatus Paceibacteria bacterium]|jgi:uncharacterized UPF0160 family protein
MKKIIVHNDRFHADEVFAVATLDLVFNGDIEVVRTRDEDIMDSADIVIDVGGIYDFEKGRFDHHQAEGAGERENGIPYASFGLVWKHFGDKLCDRHEAWEFVDRNIVQVIDAGDNGFSTFKLINDDIGVYQIGTLIGAFNPTWKESGDLYDKNFKVVVEIAKKVLEREIKKANDKSEAIPEVEKAYEETEDKRLIVLEKNYQWGEVLHNKDDVLYVITPSKLGDAWRVNTIQDKEFTNRKSFPKEWAGLRGGELQEVSGVEDAKFCHRKLFLAVAQSKEGAIKLANIAINS